MTRSSTTPCSDPETDQRLEWRDATTKASYCRDERSEPIRTACGVRLRGCARGARAEVPAGHLQVPSWGKGAGVVTRSSTTPCSDPEPDQGTLGRLSFSQGPSGQVESLRRTTSSIRRTGQTCWGSRWQPRRAGRSVASVDLGMRCQKGGPEKKQLVRFFGLGLTVLASLSLVGLAVVFFLRPPLLPQSSVSGVPRGSQPSTPPVPRRVFRV